MTNSVEKIKREWAKVYTLRPEDFSNEDDESGNAIVDFLLNAKRTLAVATIQQEGINLGAPKTRQVKKTDENDNRMFNMRFEQTERFFSLIEDLVSLQEFDVMLELLFDAVDKNDEFEELFTHAVPLLLQNGRLDLARKISTGSFVSSGIKYQVILDIAKETNSFDDINAVRNLALNRSGQVCVGSLLDLFVCFGGREDLETARCIASALNAEDRIFSLIRIAEVSDTFSDYAQAIDTCFELSHEAQMEKIQFIVGEILTHHIQELEFVGGVPRLPKHLAKQVVDAIRHPQLRQKTSQCFGIN